MLRRLFCAFLTVFALLMANAARFVVLSDIHITPGAESEAALRQAVAEINAGGAGPLDAVIVCGDLTNEGSNAELAAVRSVLDEVTAAPLLVIPGNHENNWSESATKTFSNLFGNDRFVYQFGDSLLAIGINCGPYMKMGDGHVKSEDLAWLKRTMSEFVGNDGGNDKKIISFNHYPLREGDMDAWREYGTLLSEFPVITHICGHYHKWIRYNVGDMDCVMVRAFKMKDGYGYAVIETDPDWIHFYNKVLGQTRQPVYALAAKTKHKGPEGRNADTGAKLYEPGEGFKVECVWADSASVFTRVATDADRVYFGNSLGKVKAVNKATGEQVWEISTGSPLFSRPVVLEKGMLAVPANDGLYIVSAPTGKLSKKYASVEGPYVADGLYTEGIYVQGGYKRMERRRPTDGKLLWSYDSLANYCQGAPVINDGELIFGAWDTNLRCLDVNTGRMKWAWNNGKPGNQLGPGNVVPVVTREKVIIVAPDRYMTAIDRRTGKTIWRDNSHKYRESLGVSEDGSRVYAKTMDGELVCVDALSPEFNELWTVDLGLGYEHAPCIVLEKDGVVYCGSRRGLVTAVDPAQKKVLWQLPLGVSEVNGFEVDDASGDIYTSLIEGKIYRISRKTN